MKATECCGKPRDTKFCPDCGEELFPPTPLGRLLSYCRDRAAAAQAKVWENEKLLNQLPPEKERTRELYEGRIASAQANQKLWLLYGEWLGRAIEALDRAFPSNAAPHEEPARDER